MLNLKEVTWLLILHFRDRQECRRPAVQCAGFVPVEGTPRRTLPPFCVTDAFAIDPDDDADVNRQDNNCHDEQVLVVPAL
jgi:hypothetical protein